MQTIYHHCVGSFLLLGFFLSGSLETRAAEAATNATVVFYRPGKFSMAATKIIVGSTVPDKVYVKLNNGKYYKLKVDDCRKWEFLGGIYQLSASVNLDVKPGQTYYVRCSIKESFPAAKATLAEVDAATAQKEMGKLKPQQD